MSTFDALEAQHARRVEEQTMRALTETFGFSEARSREAVAAIGDKSDVQMAYNWLLDHGEEDKGGAVTLRHCPHTDRMKATDLVAPSALRFGAPCKMGCAGGENWLCLFCGETYCSRYVKQHCLQHWKETQAAAEQALTVADAAQGQCALGHHLALSLSDLSVWCYACDGYIEPSSGVSPVCHALVLKAQQLKFGTGEEAASSAEPPVKVGDPLGGTEQQQHGTRGAGRDWAPPAVAVASGEIARPGYRSCAAHEYLDSPEVVRAKVQVLAELIREASGCVAYTGAGISTSSGIKDYASKAGSLGGQAAGSPWDASPTLAHRVLTALHFAGRMPMWVQQNHDGLPQKAGFPQHCLNEIHGAWFDPSNPVVPMDGTLREDLLTQLLEWEEKTDLCLAMGSTLCGMNADRLCLAASQKAKRTGRGGLVIVNLQRTQYDHLCSLRLFARLDDVCGQLAEALGLTVQGPAAPPRWPSEVFDMGGTRVDLSAGAKVRLVDQPAWDKDKHGPVGTVQGRTEAGDWRIQVGGIERRLGWWWVQAALAGTAKLPVENIA